MITYELAKQLYKKGSPFKSAIPITESNMKYIDFPPLSKLIEACGDRFDTIEKRGDTYFAFGSSKTKTGIKIDPFLGAGSTPEEAVSKLWLELDNKI